MKRQALNHTKMDLLMSHLRIPRYAAVGILESLWHLTAREAPRGDIGKLSDERIAIGIDWRGAANRTRQQEATRLVHALTESGWLDSHDSYRLVVHDWHDHADEAVKKFIKRNNLTWASLDMSGNAPTRPDMSCLPVPVPVPVPEGAAALERDALGPVIPIRTAKDAGLLPPAGPAPAEEPAPRDGAMLYLAAYPVQVAQDSACRAYLSVIRTRRQHDELMAGLERHKASALWRDKEGELNLAEIAKWYPPDKFITKRTYQDHPPPRAKPKESTFRDTMDPEVKRRIAEMRAQGIKPGALQ